jgi:stage II sporulation protein D
MKKIFIITLFLLAIMLLLPLSALSKNDNTPAALQTSTPVESVSKTETFKVLITETQEIAEVNVSDYIFGVVAAEMPALYETEALKAQAVCAYTFALWRKSANTDKEYDITDNSGTDQCYITKEQAIAKWGSNADEYRQKIENAVNEVNAQALTYNGEIILSVYHAISSGVTETAKNVWGKDYPYLQSVSSTEDKLAQNYISTKSFTLEEVKSALKISNNITENPFSDFVRTDARTVKSVKVCGTEYKGSEIREAFDLKSSNFEVEFKNNNITFTTYGYGHGVGMSQNGANYMAQQGSDYKEILLHYYKDCEIKTIQ